MSRPWPAPRRAEYVRVVVPARAPRTGRDALAATGWRLIVVMALLSSVYSTVVIVLASHRIGRDIFVSFMEVGTVLLRDGGMVAHPGVREIAAGIAVHMSADMLWTVLFFRFGARWLGGLRPARMLALAPLWAVATEALEYHVLLPWLQPVLIVQTPFWVGLGIHLASVATYGVVFAANAGDGPAAARHDRIGRRVAGALAVVLIALGVAEILCAARREPAWPHAAERAAGFDGAFMRRMAAHHAAGVTLAALAAERASGEDLRALGRLMVAEQEGEIASFERWWESWFGGALPPPPAAEHATMRGMPSDQTLAALDAARGAEFDRRFVDVMVLHHEGAVQMATDAWHHARDPRLRLLATQISHTQEAQITRMLGIQAARR